MSNVKKKRTADMQRLKRLAARIRNEEHLDFMLAGVDAHLAGAIRIHMRPHLKFALRQK
jgi:hypothetical protein